MNSSDQAISFTILTATYNRAHTLGRVYRSLCLQSRRDLEWVVVDDGSTDNTRELIEAWKRHAPFTVRYFWQPNQHKKSAFNRGVRESRGEWIVALDSDDELEPRALQRMGEIWLEIAPEERERYVGVTGLCARADGTVVGDRFPRDTMDATSLDMHFRHHVRGEKFGCQRASVLRKFPFREDTAGFVPEGSVWGAIARAGYLTRYVNEVFRVYHDSTDSYSRQVSAANAAGLLLIAHETLEHNVAWFRYRPSAFLMAAARYTRFSIHVVENASPRPVGMHLTHPLSKVLVAAMAPVGVALYLRDRRTWRNRSTRPPMSG